MLMLSRRVGEVIVINGNIQVQVVETRDGKVRLGVTAPPEIEIMRGEIRDQFRGKEQGNAAK